MSRLDLLLHPRLRQTSPEELRLARLTAAICLVLQLAGLLSVPSALGTGELRILGTILLVVVLYAFALVLLRVFGAQRAAGHAVVGTFLGALVEAIDSHGALHLSGAAWVAMTPLLAVLLLGGRAAVGWTVAACAGVAGLAFREHGSASEAEAGLVVQSASSIVIMLVALLLIARSFHATKTRMAAQLSTARNEAERARDAAAAHASARRLLDNVDHGLFTVGGRMVDLLTHYAKDAEGLVAFVEEAASTIAALRVRALFSDGISTAVEVTTVSGRGVGLAALREATERLGGRVRVDSSPGTGTTFAFSIPCGRAQSSGSPPTEAGLQQACVTS